jgi:hypothetical protein
MTDMYVCTIHMFHDIMYMCTIHIFTQDM